MIAIISITILLALIVRSNNEKPDPQFLKSEFIEAKRNWSTYLQQSFDPKRSYVVKEAINRTVGVLRAQHAIKSINLSAQLRNTVWIGVVESSKDIQNARYKLLLRNFLCYLQHYGIKVLLFLLDNSNSNFIVEARNLTSLFGDTVTIVPYPYQLFWKFVSEKKSVINREYNAGDYKGANPTFKHFGALVTLVPIYEILKEGYGVIYLDIDISLLRNPLPYLTLGDADFITAQELRTCDFPSFISQQVQWSSMEPNTGVLHVKASRVAINFMHRWIVEMVEQNKMNDQRVLSFNFAKNPIHTTSCKHEDHSASEGPHLQSTSLNLTSLKEKETFKYCFLNEFVFQNGKMEFFCSKGAEDPVTFIYPSSYYLGMRRFCPPLIPPLSQGHQSHQNQHQHQQPLHQSPPSHRSLRHHPSHSQSGDSRLVLCPVLLHVNYCDDKVKLLQERGMLLFNSTYNTCAAFRPSRTSFARTNWTSQIDLSRRMVAAELGEIGNGSVVKYKEREGLYYLLADGRLHLLVAGKAALSVRRVREKDVKSVSRAIFLTLPRGMDLK